MRSQDEQYSALEPLLGFMSYILGGEEMTEKVELLSWAGKLSEAKLRFGLSDSELAYLIGCSAFTIPYVESGKKGRHLTEVSQERLDWLLSGQKPNGLGELNKGV